MPARSRLISSAGAVTSSTAACADPGIHCWVTSPEPSDEHQVLPEQNTSGLAILHLGGIGPCSPKLATAAETQPPAGALLRRN
jgi:hypothetical protein